MAQMDQSMFKHAEYAVVTVSDMTRSIKFYRDVLGLPLKFESKDWSEFITGTTTIALHGGGKLAPATMNKQGELLAGTCTLGFSVEDYCGRSEEHTSELQSQSNLVCRLLLEK